MLAGGKRLSPTESRDEKASAKLTEGVKKQKQEMQKNE